ncbi:MAG: SGNH/GDSL hydrolase family protein [Chloroflexi bacterium]|nr:SGNH/GDSL hydrolase family protein [Chloroflexota bacterium]
MTKPLERIEWLDIWVAGADLADLPRLLMIGDSICRGYYGDVDAALVGRYHCARLCNSTCVCDPTYLKQLDLLLDDYTWDTIHFNTGLHSGSYTTEEYTAGLERAWAHLRAKAPQARFRWASSTPVRQQGLMSDLNQERTDWVHERNAAAERVAASQGVGVTDLCSVTIARPDYFSADGVHYNAEGNQALAQAVLKGLGLV